MAERLPRYRPLGAQIPSLPSVDYTQTGRAQAAVYGQISAALDKVSEFAFARAEAKTKQEAIEYAFDNPVTVQQLEDARVSGVDIDDIVGDKNTVFGATLRATTGKIMRTDLEGAYRTEIAAMQKTIESPDFRPEDLADITSRLRNTEIGYAEALADVDPNEALAFKATAATLGSSVYKTALEEVNKKRALGLRMAAQEQVDNFSDAARATIKTLDFDGNVNLLDKELDVLSNSLKSYLYRTGDAEFAETETAKIDGVILSAKTDVLVEHALSEEYATNPHAALAKMRTGDFGDYSSIYNDMSDEERAEVKKRIRTEANAQDTTNEKTVRNEVRRQSSMVSRIVSKIETADEDTRDTLIDDLYQIATDTNGQAISPITIRSLEKELEEGATSNSLGNLEFRMAIQRGEVTQENFEEKRVEFGVTAKDGVGFFDKMLTVDKSADREVMRIARRSAKVYSEVQPYNDEQATQIEKFLRRAEGAHASAISEWEAGGEEGPKPLLVDTARKLQNEFIASGFTEEIERVLGRMNESLTISDGTVVNTFEFNEYTTEEDIDDLDLSLHPKPEELRKILKTYLKSLEDYKAGRADFF